MNRPIQGLLFLSQNRICGAAHDEGRFRQRMNNRVLLLPTCSHVYKRILDRFHACVSSAPVTGHRSNRTLRHLEGPCGSIGKSFAVQLVKLANDNPILFNNSGQIGQLRRILTGSICGLCQLLLSFFCLSHKMWLTRFTKRGNLSHEVTERG